MFSKPLFSIFSELELNKTIKKRSVFSFIFLLFYTKTSIGAFCSLRSPSEAIGELFPTYTNYQTIVAKVTRENREELKAKLPFKFHFNEVGQHALYFVKKDKMPLGFAHSRSEMAPWGMMEIAWAFDWNLNINGVKFQRCRSAVCHSLFIDQLISDIKGKNIPKLLDYWKTIYPTENSSPLMPTEKSSIVVNNNRDLAIKAIKNNKQALLKKIMVKSAIKTLMLTHISWKKKITQLKSEHLIQTVLLDGKVPNSIRVPIALSEKEKLANQGLSSLFSLTEGLIIKSGEDKTILGYFASTHWEADDLSGEALWVFGGDGHLKQVSSQDYWPNTEIASAFTNMEGKKFTSQENCATALELSAHELFKSLSNSTTKYF